jgi:hypothetical protein
MAKIEDSKDFASMEKSTRADFTFSQTASYVASMHRLHLDAQSLLGVNACHDSVHSSAGDWA